MNKNILNESLDYHDLVDIVLPKAMVDEYAAKMGKDSEIVTLAFVVKNKQAGEDLCDWFERGYDFVLDAEVSEGELSPGKFVVFVEMNRRTSVPERICELLSDLKTLTDIDLKDWTITYKDEDYEPDPDILKQILVLSPHQYRLQNENEKELNEMREIAGLETSKIFSKQDKDITDFKSIAGL